MRCGLIKIGNSHGIRIPKPFIKQCGFEKTVNLEVSGNSLVISPVSECRKGWMQAFKTTHANSDDEFSDFDLIESEFDRSEWTW